MVVGQLTIETDVAVLGGGPGGYVAAIRAADLGLNVILVEKRDRLGGVCLLEGCIPSKSLIHAARLIDAAREAGKIGISFAEPAINLDELRKWKDTVVDGLSKGVDSLLKNRGVEVIHGHGHFTSNKRISVEEADVFIEFKNAIIATGSSMEKLPEGYPADVWSSVDALRLLEIPARMLVITDEYYGFELAQIYAALGSKVTITGFDPALLFEADKDLVDVMLRRLSKSMETILGKSTVIGIEKSQAGYTVRIEDKKGPQTEEFDRVLVARGRIPSTSDLRLDTTKIVPDKNGFIDVNGENRTIEPHIFAVGDVTRGPMFAYMAAREGKVVAEVIANRPAAMDNRAIPAIIFTNPEIAWTGLSEREAEAEQKKFKVAKFPLRALGEAHILGQTEGFTKILYDPDTLLVLGVGIVGPGASELITEGTLALEMGATLEDLLVTLHPHPTMAESLMEAAELAHGTPVHIIAKGIVEKK